jgi:putative ABC transport system permease protein
VWAFSIVPHDERFRVIGIVEHEPYAGMRNFARGNVFIPMGLAETLRVVGGTDVRDVVRSVDANGNLSHTYPTLTVRVDQSKHVEAIENSIKQMGFSSFSLLDATRSLRRFFAVLDLFLGIFGSLALAVASLGIVNTLVMAILERRREIGIMKALGASDLDVRRLFFAEAGAMGAFGGVIGVLLGWAIGRAINFAANVYLHRQQLPPERIWFVPWWLIGGAIAFSLLVSLISGLYPAARAARLDPVQTLRYE